MTDLHFDPALTEPLCTAEPEGALGFVLFTDGGSDLDIGLGGWGLHGYSYSVQESKKHNFSKQKGVPSTIGFVDGRLTKFDDVKGEDRTLPTKLKMEKKGWLSYPDNPQSYPVTPMHLINIHGSIDRGTNNACELTGMLRALQLVLQTKPKQVVILADSEYVLCSLLSYCKKWETNGWMTQNGPVKNQDVMKAMWASYRQVMASETRLELGHVFGHSGDPGNDKADALSTRGKIRCRQLQRDKDAQHAKAEFERSVVDIRLVTEVKAAAKTMVCSRLFEQRYWYGLCNRGAKDWGGALSPYHVYLLGDHGKMSEPEMIGVEVSTSKIAVLIAREPEPVFDGLQALLHKEYYDGVSRVTLGALPHITKKERYAKLTEDLPNMVFPAGDNKLLSDDGAVLLEKLTPAWNGYRLVDELERLVRLGEEFLVSPETLVVTDVTDQLFEQVPKGKKIEYRPRSCVNPPNRTVTLRVRAKLTGAEYDDVICKLDTDLPTRNTLAAIAGEETRVYIVTIRTSGSSYLYYGLVHCPEGLLVTAALTANHVVRKGPTTT